LSSPRFNVGDRVGDGAKGRHDRWRWRLGWLWPGPEHALGLLEHLPATLLQGEGSGSTAGTLATLLERGLGRVLIARAAAHGGSVAEMGPN
jgi:hypothetical protein